MMPSLSEKGLGNLKLLPWFFKSLVLNWYVPFPISFLSEYQFLNRHFLKPNEVVAMPIVEWMPLKNTPRRRSNVV